MSALSGLGQSTLSTLNHIRNAHVRRYSALPANLTTDTAAAARAKPAERAVSAKTDTANGTSERLARPIAIAERETPITAQPRKITPAQTETTATQIDPKPAIRPSGQPASEPAAQVDPAAVRPPAVSTGNSVVERTTSSIGDVLSVAHEFAAGRATLADLLAAISNAQKSGQPAAKGNDPLQTPPTRDSGTAAAAVVSTPERAVGIALDTAA